MNNLIDNDTEQQLSELTRWPDESPELYKVALEEHCAAQATPLLKREFHFSSFSGRWAAVLVFGAISIIVVGLLLPSLGRAREQAAASPLSSAPSAEAPYAKVAAALEERVNPSGVLDIYMKPDMYGIDDELSLMDAYTGDQMRAFPARGGGGMGVRGDRMPGQNSMNTPPLAERAVVHTWTIELESDDVRSTFLKSLLLVSTAHGEFVEQSRLSGDVPTARANITMRISLDRLDDVLNKLRGLGEVIAESSDSKDLTNQIVDLNARITNERSVELELLKLLESREDAPLEDILSLRNHISNARMRIERLEAQRKSLGKLVALATVLVIITPADLPDVPEEPEQSSLGDYFKQHVSDAWATGLRVLVNSIAFLIKLLVSGLLVWIALIGLGVSLRHFWLRRVALGLV